MSFPMRGSLVALPTPFDGEGTDLKAFQEMIDFHVEHGTHGIVVAGTTGEASTLSEHERRSLIHAAIEFAAGRIPVIAGVGTNSTLETVELARFAGACGADALLVVTPYYNRPSRTGLLRHFGAIADVTGTPIVLYNVPGRTGTDLDPGLAAELSRAHENIVAIKEATNSIQRAREVIENTDLAVFCGEDSSIADFMQLGAAGAISVAANLVPDEVAELVEAARPGGDSVRAAELVEFLAPLVRDLFIEVNPVPLKAALARLQRCSGSVRAPLAELEDAHRVQLESTLLDYTALGTAP
jgi:4-hydroxy-tetrahydrodipicolinate synthase